LTPVPSPVRWLTGGTAISDSDAVDFEAFERRVRALVKKHRRLRDENAGLRETLARRDRTVRELEEQIRELNQRRSDTGKRLDELIARIGQLDAQLESGAAAAKGAKA
jgi:septal ring factor EnvC (AmiA/AmiB activator)